eukprot:1538743-Pyramimonas_sp.AAC.1
MAYRRWRCNTGRIYTAHASSSGGSNANQQGGWASVPEDVIASVMTALQWKRGESAAVRRVCVGWQQAHDRALPEMNVRQMPTNKRSWQRFPGVRTLGAQKWKNG